MFAIELVIALLVIAFVGGVMYAFYFKRLFEKGKDE